MLLFYDVETTGFARFELPCDDPAQPRLVEIAALLTDDKGNAQQTLHARILPDGWTVPDGAARVHGLTTEILEKTGMLIDQVIALFNSFRERATLCVAHNMEFDEFVVRGELRRLCLPELDVPGFCTMKAATDIVNLAPTGAMLATGRHHAKAPNLGEAYEFFTGDRLVNAHTALADTKACRRVYFGILEHQKDG